MNLMSLSNEDFNEVEALFTDFHAGYAAFFQNRTRSVAKPAKDYLQGQLFTQQEQNLSQYCREVPHSEYEAIHHFISVSPWDDAQLIQQLQQDVCHLLGDAVDGALILDESGIAKQGKMSVGVSRQYCGRLGKVDNCQVGVYLAYANSHHASLVDYRMYLPESWIVDTQRLKTCGVPDDIGFQTKAQLGLQMIRAFKAAGLPFGWVSIDSHYGEQPWLLEALSHEGICYMADIPADTRIFVHCPQTQVPHPKPGRGRPPTKERVVDGTEKPIEVRAFAQTLTESDWTRLSIRETERGWLIADFAANTPVYGGTNGIPLQPPQAGVLRLAFGR